MNPGAFESSGSRPPPFFFLPPVLSGTPCAPLPLAGLGGGVVSSPASSTSSIARSMASHPPTTASTLSLLLGRPLQDEDVSRGGWSAFERTFLTAAARSHPSAPIVCTAGMSSFWKNTSRRSRAAASDPAKAFARSNAASIATRV